VQSHAADAGGVPPQLTTSERRELVAFLRTLSADGTDEVASPPCELS
jgi:hypothetical protein